MARHELREAILDQGLELASVVGISGLTIGTLAKHVGLSKSGLYAHFSSKQALQMQLLEHAGEYLHRAVIGPAFERRGGDARVEALVENWIDWASGEVLPGGCVLLAASLEYDDIPGPERERIAALQRDWIGSLALAARSAIEDGLYRADLDCERFAFEAFGLLVSLHIHVRLLEDERAVQWTRSAFESLRHGARLAH